MARYKRMFHWVLALFFYFPLISFAATPIKSVVFFGDSLSDTGNTTHLLKTLRNEEDPGFLVSPLKMLVLNKMEEFAEDYYVPQIVLDSGVAIVTDFFDRELAPILTALVTKIKLVPLLPGKPYWNSRFSNGKVWNEYLAEMISIPQDDEERFINRSFGGSWAVTYDYQLTVLNLIRYPIGTIKNLIIGKLVPPSLGLAVQGYLMEYPKLSNETVFFIFSGGNDYINSLSFEENYTPSVMNAYIDNVVSAINSSVTKLMHSGARRFVVMGLPHLGETPHALNTPDRDILNAAIDVHNERLQSRIKEWENLYPDTNFLFINMRDYFDRAISNSALYGFTNISDACIDVTFPLYHALRGTPFVNNFVLNYAQVLQYKDKSFSSGDTNFHVCSTPENYLFWDEIHPSTRAHGFFAFELCKTMEEHGYRAHCRNPID